MPHPDGGAPRETSAYRYALPGGLIAQAPADPPDASRLMVLSAGGAIAHRTFADLPELLRADDLLVLNETRVLRARLRGRREPSGGAVELLLLKPLDAPRFSSAARRWEALVRPGRKLREGAEIRIGDVLARIAAVHAEDGIREVEFPEGTDLEALLEQNGEMPLPPYVGPGDEARATRYQTIFARVPGSVAAPTASLHFTPCVLSALEARGVEVARIELDVGYGTFKPIDSASIDEHPMHAERYAIAPQAAVAINRALAAGRRVVAAGTTVLRALESAALPDAPGVAEGERQTSLYIRPGFRFRVAGALLTNFHLPASSLLVLVAAFAGYARTMAAYRTAVEERYRFFSFGDAMLIER